MTAERNIAKETAAAEALKQVLIGMGEDEEALRDTIEGQTELHGAIAAVMDEINECDILAMGIDKIIEDYKDRLHAVTSRAKRLRTAIELAMMAGKIKTLTLPEATLTLKAVPPSVQVTDESAIPAQYWQAGEPRLSKRMLGEALKGGQTVPGACMSNGGVTLQIRRS